ncbi:hypothetical protein K505DRAFT_376850 [Melanomma pulvis-pyrius CBS 109.77]|uniref:Xylanolytic transcriptional activator regulatory domain-containing protein n=1 Tax=Melanomma pulvis-pyrius CBS 109.77 TaxID=1314802 RepID=A0A6A6X4T1_9PLEO|nr:hypothetical protein K505DRAFT_376850 [Melanomma pulvis-pyrius CBS 109.77]
MSLKAFVESMIFPGAGLNGIDDNSRSGSCTYPPITPLSEHEEYPVPTARNYDSDEGLLNAYYIFIHPYFPVLPPPKSPLQDDNPIMGTKCTFQPSSPISLAISAILALIPCTTSPLSDLESSRLFRRDQAQLFAELAMESIEIESEVLQSTSCPAEALSSSPLAFQRRPFHPDAPIELESILALLILSIYEYAQRGNLTKMRNRASQALDAAMRISLHETSSSVGDPFQESKSRAWWMTYMCVLQSSIVSNTAPIIEVNRHCFSAPLPTINGDSATWRALLGSQDLIMKCTQYTTSLKRTLDAGGNTIPLESSFLMLDAEIQNLLAINVNSEILFESDVDSIEAVLIGSLQTQSQIKLHSARIKLHRYQAFRDIPIFTKRHCDLKASPNYAPSQFTDLLCPLIDQQVQPPRNTPDSSFFRSPTSQSSNESEREYKHSVSARICLLSALAISKAFNDLPFPCPMQSDHFDLQNLGTLPRTMPAFACCAMQGSYVLLMICLKNQENSQSYDAELRSSLDVLYSGLERILHALDNYSFAFEALQGMTNQVRDCFEAAKP